MSDTEYAYEVVSTSPMLRLERGESQTVWIRIRNAGPARWFDVGVKKNLPEGARPVQLGLHKGIELLDFKIHWGEGETTDRKFGAVYERNGSLAGTQHAAKPGQIVLFKAVITAKKFATKGMHRIPLEVVFSDNDEALPAGRSKPLRIYVPGANDITFHSRRALKVILARPGRLHSRFTNNAYDQLPAEPAKREAAVVMATWRRIEYLPKTVGHLLEQTGVQPVLHIWNNNPGARAEINTSVEGSPLPIRVHHSAANIGGYGRYYLARDLADRYDRVVFIDDDQLPGPKDIAQFYDEYEPGAIYSRWAHKFIDARNYWHKRQIEPGEQADYVGTCGMVCPTSIFRDPRTFACPKRYWFIEDLWLSFVADHYLKWKLGLSKVVLPAVEDGRDQMTGLIDHKTRMLKYLVRRRGWQIFKR